MADIKKIGEEIAAEETLENISIDEAGTEPEAEKSCLYFSATSCGVTETEFEHPENKSKNENKNMIFLI